MIYNLGRVVPLFKGAYDAATTYTFLDVVFYDNSSFVALGNTTGNLPTDTDYWLPVALKGTTQDVTPEQMATIISEVETYMGTTDFVQDANYQHIDIVDNLNSTDTNKALSAKQGNVLKETIYGTNDTTEGDDILSSFLDVGAFGFKNASSGSPSSTVVYYYNYGNTRAKRLTITTFASLELKKYRYLRITGSSTGYYSYVTFLKKDRPTTNNMTYQDLVDGGYLSSVHYDAAHVAIAVPNGQTKDIEIPLDAKSVVVAGRLSTDSNTLSTTVRVPSSIKPYGLLQPDNVYYQVAIPDGYVKSNMIGDGEVKTNDIADGAINGDKLEDDLVRKEMTSSTNEYFSFNLLDFNNLTTGYINSNGTVTTVSNYYTTHYIKLDGKKVYWGMGFISSYGSYSSVGGCVYDANKTKIRVFGAGSSGSYDPITANEGAEYIRLTYTGNYTQRFVVYAKSDGTNPMSGYTSITTDMIDDYYRDQIINNASINIRFPKENVPETIPAISMCGQNGVLKKYTSITGGNYVYVANTEYPSYIKCNHTISFKGNIANAMSGSDSIKFGINRNSTEGKILEITPTAARIRRYDSTNGYTTNVSFNHGLTIKDFVMCEVSFNWYGGKMRIVSSGGYFVKEWNISEYSYTGNSQINYGRCFLEPSMDMTNVKISQSSDRFMKPVWVCGDSYTSMYAARWTNQLINNYGVDGFLIDGYPGAQSSAILTDLKKALQFGTPKYLVWCLGMNDNSVLWKYCATELECMCRERGITLIYQTIPQPVSTTTNASEKPIINNYITQSGYRYIDAYSAVCKDDNGTWYDGMLDDGIHPTVLGAQALAGQVLVDFPEIANYK